MSVAENISARTAALVASSPTPNAESASPADGARPPPAAAVGVDSASGVSLDETAAGHSPAAPGGGDAPEAPITEEEQRRALYAEKLAAIRQQNRERRELGLGARARAEAERLRAEAQAEKERAAAERADLAAGRKDFRKFFEANGMNPREAYEEMTRQAIEAGTPEGQLKAAQEAWKEEMTGLRSEVEALRKERDDARAQAEAQAAESEFRSHFDDAVKSNAAAFESLRDAYTDDALIAKAAFLRDNPEAFYANLDTYKLRLTNPGKGFNMTDILNVLAAADAAYEENRAKRRAARTAAAPPSNAAPQAAPSPTVNGTAEKRNAGEATIGNDLTTARASDGRFVPQGNSAAMRVRERVRRLSGG